MKQIFIFLFILSSISCMDDNEDLKPMIEYVNHYTLQDDPSDSIKHKVYTLYKNYGVPIYFNDTIGQNYVGQDLNGNLVYNYELLDIGWSFFSYDSRIYSYDYMSDPSQKMRAITMIERFLKESSNKLYPFNFFVVEGTTSTNKNDRNNVEYYDGGKTLYKTRSIVLCGNVSEDIYDNYHDTIIRKQIRNKISQFTYHIARFGKTSNSEWYNTTYKALDPNLYEWADENDVPRWKFAVSCLEDDSHLLDGYTEEFKEEFRAQMRKRIGAFGFVSAGVVGMVSTPNNSESDLMAFISEMLRWPRETFIELWGECPLVIKKYELLYDVINNELGVTL